MSDVVQIPTAKFIETHVKSSPYSVGEIAILCGFKNGEMIEGFITGERKVPLDKVLPLAQALECDRRQLFSLALRSWFGEAFVNDMEDIFGASADSPAERSWLICLREFYAGQIPEITPNLRRRLRLIIGLPS